MKCRKCGGKAVIRIRAHNIALCEEDFLDFVLDRVQKAIRSYHLLKKEERVLVALSGGKDSLAAFDLLQRLGYQVEAFHIDLGIDGFSEASLEAVKAFVKERGATLHLLRVEDELGMGVVEAARRLRRPPCSLCGMIKRYLMNRFAYERGFSAVVTGHNLDDEGATLLGNLLRWQTGYLSRQAPLLPSSHPRLIKKVKPLVLLSEREVLAYCLLRPISYLPDRCPYAKGATSIPQKEALNLLELHSPGTKLRFYQGFLEARGSLSQEEGELRECEVCGFLTVREKCQFCTLKERLNATEGRER